MPDEIRNCGNCGDRKCKAEKNPPNDHVCPVWTPIPVNPCRNCPDESTIGCEYCDKVDPETLGNRLRIAMDCAHCATCRMYTCPVPNAVNQTPDPPPIKDEDLEKSVVLCHEGWEEKSPWTPNVCPTCGGDLSKPTPSRKKG